MHFTVNNDKYIATWYVRKKRTGTYDVSDRRKLEKVINGNHIVILNDVKGVNSKIQELIGLSYEQFVRSVMLAQGEFSTFLKSAKNQQSEILEMLTGTEIYSKIAEAVKKKITMRRRKRKLLKNYLMIMSINYYRMKKSFL